MAESRTLETNGETIGMPVSRAVVEANRPSTGIPQQRDVHEEREMGTLRQQSEDMRQRVADITKTISGTARQAARHLKDRESSKDWESSIRFRAFCLLQLRPGPSHVSLPVFGPSIQNEDEWPGKMVGRTTLLSRQPTTSYLHHGMSLQPVGR
ncbi:hypothetical protein [Rhizobium sp. IBUN]|uniref:hypothetical protein n=1 Tax=Rhizobium sp. IBUN TaxID=1042326 RepID=UPI0004724A76|nr:hypothetical protein [Rhizobium sp. IBUN]